MYLNPPSHNSNISGSDFTEDSFPDIQYKMFPLSFQHKPLAGDGRQEERERKVANILQISLVNIKEFQKADSDMKNFRNRTNKKGSSQLLHPCETCNVPYWG